MYNLEIATRMSSATDMNIPRTMLSTLLLSLCAQKQAGAISLDERWDWVLLLLELAKEFLFTVPIPSSEPNPLITGLDLDSKMMKKLEDMGVTIRLEQKQVLFESGDFGSQLFIVRKGRVKAIAGSKTLAEWGPGELFGELGYLLETPRSATVVACSPGTVLLQLDKSTVSSFEQLLGQEGMKVMDYIVRRRVLSNFRKYDNCILNDSFVFKLSLYDTIALNCSLQIWPPNSCIFRKGDPSSHFYIIVAGSVFMPAAEAGNTDNSSSSSSSSKGIAGKGKGSDTEGGEQGAIVFGPGMHFGEVGLLENSKRSFSIIAAETKTVLVAMDKQGFENFVSVVPKVLSVLNTGGGGQRKGKRNANSSVKGSSSINRSSSSSSSLKQKLQHGVAAMVGGRYSPGEKYSDYQSDSAGKVQLFPHVQEKDGLAKDAELIDVILQLLRVTGVVTTVSAVERKQGGEKRKQELMKRVKSKEGVLLSDPALVGNTTRDDLQSIKRIQKDLLPFFSEAQPFLNVLNRVSQQYSLSTDQVKTLTEAFFSSPVDETHKVFGKIGISQAAPASRISSKK